MLSSFPRTVVLLGTLLFLVGLELGYAFQPNPSSLSLSSRNQQKAIQTKSSLKVLQEPKTTKDNSPSANAAEDETATEKYGLEVGLFQSLKKNDGGESAKSLLKKYGVAYLATSIPLAIVSFAICYALVNAGIDVGALLGKVGIESSSTTDTAGTFAIAYAAHKAASPIRFPPTVLLTPIVAKMIGKEPEDEGESSA